MSFGLSHFTKQYIKKVLPAWLSESGVSRQPPAWLAQSKSGHKAVQWPDKSSKMANPTDSQGYLGRLSPFSRSPTVQPSKGKDGEPEPLLKQQQQGTDHRINQRHRLSLKKYPRDCPPLRPQWFHAVDSPKRRPNPAGKTEEKVLPAPKKYAAFSVRDSKAIEAGYRKLGDEVEEERREGEGLLGEDLGQKRNSVPEADHDKDDLKPGRVRVPVNEDYLFDVDVERRELGPAYWLGPVYEVRRGTWFFQENSVQRPCDENLSAQLEDGYLKVEAWKIPSQQASQKTRSASQPRTRPTSWSPSTQAVDESSKPAASAPITPKGSSGDLRKQAAEKQLASSDEPEPGGPDSPPNTYRLFGSHMNSVVTYQDGTTAWLLTDTYLSRMNYTMYQRFAGGGHFGGIKLTRGYIHDSNTSDSKEGKAVEEKDATSEEIKQQEGEEASERPSVSETRRQKLERHMSSLLDEASSEDPGKQEEEVRKRDEREMEEDYKDTEGDDQGREVEHLILVTHGIGQRLGLRLESVNFVHDVNTLRKTVKAVYADSPDLRALNAELGNAEAVNSRVQVLPICWRHLLDFPKQSLKHNRKEHDIADSDDVDDEDYPSLEDISVEGVPAVRNLITDLALDILLYQSPAYKDHISRIVLEECNRIYHLFMERNPTFKGKISFIGHSLGSAIMFDILCRQDQDLHPSKQHRKHQNHLKLDFEVEDFYALGSPIGLFQMLTGRKIVAREGKDGRKTSMTTSMDDPMLDGAAPPSTKPVRKTLDRALTSEIAVSSPKCAQIFNIFHPTDPISYRVEPLISPAMATLKPQPLPYTKRGIFGAPMGQGFTGIGARVSQSVSSMWSSMASNLLTRGLGYSGNEPAQVSNGQNNAKSNAPLSVGPGTNVSAGVIPTAPSVPEGSEIARIHEKDASGVDSADQYSHHPPTLIDNEIHTLYAGFQKSRKSVHGDASQRDLGAGAISDSEWQEAEARAKRLKREEEKVRRLNSNGRVDYAIQEGAFDINLIAAIASHLSYWSDEDVSHFIISQLLSRHRIVRPRAVSGPQA